MKIQEEHKEIEKIELYNTSAWMAEKAVKLEMEACILHGSIKEEKTIDMKQSISKIEQELNQFKKAFDAFRKGVK